MKFFTEERMSAVADKKLELMLIYHGPMKDSKGERYSILSSEEGYRKKAALRKNKKIKLDDETKFSVDLSSEGSGKRK